MPDRDAQIEELKCAVAALRLAVDRLEAALPRNDLGLPDADGHRQYHAGKIRQAQEVRGYQMAVTQKILLWGAGALLALLGAGFWQTVTEKLEKLGAL